jgi:hypothetical protein
MNTFHSPVFITNLPPVGHILDASLAVALGRVWISTRRIIVMNPDVCTTFAVPIPGRSLPVVGDLHVVLTNLVPTSWSSRLLLRIVQKCLSLR